MTQRRIRARIRRKYVPRTTDSRHQQAVADNVLDRQFHAPKTNCKWIADIRYVPTQQGWLYLAAVPGGTSGTRRAIDWCLLLRPPTTAPVHRRRKKRRSNPGNRSSKLSDAQRQFNTWFLLAKGSKTNEFHKFTEKEMRKSVSIRQFREKTYNQGARIRFQLHLVR